MGRPLRATYRLQFNKHFTFAEAERLVPYFRELGISHLYASPIFAARPGSSHGYDIVDPTRINPELGGEEGFGRLVARLHEAGLGIVLDIVPNHMAADRANELWMKALAFGRDTPAARTFDIDWQQGRILVPILGESLHTVLQQGDIHLEADWAGGFLLARYAEHAVPLRPASVAEVLEEAQDTEGVLTALAKQWRGLEIRPDETGIEGARSALRSLDPAARGAVEKSLARRDPAHLLDRQRWRLAHWRTARDRLTYRRFFNINELVSLRVEDPVVFDQTHRLIVSLVKGGLVDGLRIDHVDGLADPEGYCIRLRETVGPDCPILVEKILGPGEALRDWPIEGSTGYERLNDINGLFIAPEGYDALAQHLEAMGRTTASLAQRLAAAKRQLLYETFVAEVEALTALAVEIAKGRPEAGDFTREALRRAIIALVAEFPIYRSYASLRGYSPEDEAIWARTLAGVEERADPWTQTLAHFLLDRLREDYSPAGARFRVKFQQLTGPAMAKGYEDTLLYRSLALASVNEVGSDLEAPARDAETFHEIYARRAEDGRCDLIPLATHDTKRGAETRARLNVLSTRAGEWIALAEGWTAANRPLKQTTLNGEAPDHLDEWLIYQTLFAAWPISVERMEAYLTKALREAKRHTHWEDPNEAYEAATLAFAAALIEDPRASSFRRELSDFLAEVEHDARVNAIAQTILQLTLPGTPDLYQGTEFWDRSLVDPDNRRPVDWDQREALIAEASTEVTPAEDDLGVTKFRTIRKLLTLRHDQPGIFEARDYRPLSIATTETGGQEEENGDSWISFLRLSSGGTLLVALPRRGQNGDEPRSLRLQGGAELLGEWQDVFLERHFTIAEDGVIRIDPAWPFVVALRA